MLKIRFSFLQISIVLFFILLLSCNNKSSRDGDMLILDGKPRFIIGNYYNPNDLDALKEYARNGFNLVRCSADSGQLDMVKEAGMYAWINTGNIIDFSEDQDENSEKLSSQVNQYKDHPALAVWEVPDEALWNLSYPRMINKFYSPKASTRMQDSILNVLSKSVIKTSKRYESGYLKLKALDSKHPVWMNHAPRNPLDELKLFSKAADIIGCDIYPVKEGMTGHSDLVNNSLSSVGEYTEIMQAAGPGKPVWMVLQAFSWQLLEDPAPEPINPETFPSYRDSRFMAWDAILHGAKGILYWGSYKVDSNSLFWKSILAVTKEIALLEPFLVTPALKDKIKVAPIIFTSSVPTRVAYTLRKYEDDYLLVVLQEDLNQYVDVSGLEMLEGETLYELTTERRYKVKQGKIRIWHEREPHILCTSKKYEVILTNALF